MLMRLIELLVCVVAGWLLATLVGLDTHTALLGPIAGVVAWVVWDGLKAAKVARWLQSRRYNNPPKLLGVWGDFIERSRKAFRRLQRKAQDSQRRLDEFLSAIQASPNGVILLDDLGRIEWANQSASDHLGIDAQRDIRQYIRNLVRSPSFASYLQRQNFDHSVLIPGPAINGDTLAEISIRMFPYGRDRMLMLTNDVTALKRAESMRRDFVANVSHEIRTPLTVIRGFVETLQSLSLTPDEQHHYLELMGQQAARMDTLVADLLTLSRLEGSPAPGWHEWLDGDQLLERVLQDGQSLSTVTGKASQTLQRLGLSGVSLSGNISELTSAMGNLVSNAVRYTPDGGVISAGWELGSDSIKFVVRDTGPGIAPEHLPRLTERFYRVDRSRSRETGGTGLGLAIVKHVAQRHGGELHVSSVVGQGSTFVISLPIKRYRAAA
jgi:two-component system, OmpR family, phosphate regulon sensor histidine kinase PhoR